MHTFAEKAKQEKTPTRTTAPKAAEETRAHQLQRTMGNGAVQRMMAQSPAMKNVKVWFNAFIPQKKIDGPPFHECFEGDGRGFSNNIHASSRTHQEIEFDVTTLAKTIDFKDTGTTREVRCATGAEIAHKKAPPSQLTNGGVARSGGEIVVDFQEAAKNPLVWFAPAIDADVVFHVDPAARTCHLTGKHDGFPAYEAYVTADRGAGSTVYTYDPVAAGKGTLALFPPMDKTAGGAGTKF